MPSNDTAKDISTASSKKKKAGKKKTEDSFVQSMGDDSSASSNLVPCTPLLVVRAICEGILRRNDGFSPILLAEKVVISI
jgi:hypothetical protein